MMKYTKTDTIWTDKNWYQKPQVKLRKGSKFLNGFQINKHLYIWNTEMFGGTNEDENK